MKSVRFWLALVPLMTASALPAEAEQRPQSSPYDFRVKSVDYNAEDVVEINGVAGIVTHITVGKGEQYVSHAFGDEGGWSLAHKDNNYFLRPREEDSDTNLTIVTDKHVYHLILHYMGGHTVIGPDGQQTVEGLITTPWTSRQATIELTYRYPEEDSAKSAERERQRAVAQALANPFPPGPRNFAYRRSNDPANRSIAPLNVWDNYRFTYFKFAPNAELPTIFAIGADGKETVVNTAVAGPDHNILIAQMVAQGWRVRYGKQVIGVINDGFNPSIGSNPGGTNSPNVVRVPKAAAVDADGGAE